MQEVKGRNGQAYLYYRRNGVSIALPQPEGSALFLEAYRAADLSFAGVQQQDQELTWRAAITAYLSSADYHQHSAETRRQYRVTLDNFAQQFGQTLVSSWGDREIEDLRGKYAAAEAPIQWNGVRSRMIQVVDLFRRRNRGVMDSNPWREVKRLKPPVSHQNRPWPPEVLVAVLREATPEFRALLILYLLTAQRGGDVVTLTRDRYDRARQTLDIRQSKTDEPILLHVPEHLRAVLERAHEQESDRLLLTPRGVPWTLPNAQETLARLLRNLSLDRYTLHGLRATGPTALKMMGFENRAIRALTGHTSDRNLELYLRGVDHYPLAREAQEALNRQFDDLLYEATWGARDAKSSLSKKQRGRG